MLVKISLTTKQMYSITDTRFGVISSPAFAEAATRRQVVRSKGLKTEP
jgi:hypothetical protein